MLLPTDNQTATLHRGKSQVQRIAVVNKMSVGKRFSTFQLNVCPSKGLQPHLLKILSEVTSQGELAYQH